MVAEQEVHVAILIDQARFELMKRRHVVRVATTALDEAGLAWHGPPKESSAKAPITCGICRQGWQCLRHAPLLAVVGAHARTVVPCPDWPS